VKDLRVVLVRPASAANVGAVARVVASTGLSGLDLVRPGDWRTVECWRTAWGGHDVLESTRVFEDLSSALADATFAAAFSVKRAEGLAIDVRDAAARVAALGSEDVGRLVFGPETSGLSLAELSLCGTRVSIPTHPRQPSLNLSHAVMVAAYEVFRAARRSPEEPRRARHDEKERMLALLRSGLVAIEGLPEANTEGFFQEWRGLFLRLELSPRELRLLEHMARKMALAGRRRS
jgi:tRNA/rRNA methyltransferase